MADTKNQIPANKLAGAFHYTSNPTVELMTNTGVFLWYGREATEKKSFIISTEGFLKRLRNMESAIAKDDPWADRTYLEIQHAIDEAVYAFSAKIDDLKELLDDKHRRLKFGEVENKRTVTLEIVNHSRLGWRALEVLLLADDAARLVFQAQHRGRITSSDKNLLIRSIEAIYRNLTQMVQRWKYFGVTRDDVAANTQPAQAARAALGDIEKEYLEAAVRSTYAPDLPKRRVDVSADKSSEEVASSITEMRINIGRPESSKSDA